MAVKDVTDFTQEVLEESRRVPVLVDFWAPWCGPCRTLGPVLEKLASEDDAGWQLAKLNTDENQAVARQYRVQSIPAVKLFVDGEVVDEFVGALPEPQVRKWLEKAIPNETRRLLDEAKRLLDQGESDKAEALLEPLLESQPDNADAAVLMAAVLTLSHPTAAAERIRDARGYSTDLQGLRDAVVAVTRLADLGSEAEAWPDTPARAIYMQAIQALTSSDVENALEGFIQVVRQDRRLDNDGARRACLALFLLLGNQSPTTKRFRKTLEMALF